MIFWATPLVVGKLNQMKAKVQVIYDYNRPKTKHNLRAWLGLTGYYRKCIPNYAARSANSTDALSAKKPEKLVWTTETSKG